MIQKSYYFYILCNIFKTGKYIKRNILGILSMSTVLKDILKVKIDHK